MFRHCLYIWRGGRNMLSQSVSIAHLGTQCLNLNGNKLHLQQQLVPRVLRYPLQKHHTAKRLLLLVHINTICHGPDLSAPIPYPNGIRLQCLRTLWSPWHYPFAHYVTFPFSFQSFAQHPPPHFHYL